MAKDFPCHDLLAEPLQQSFGQLANAGVHNTIVVTTYARNLNEVGCRVYPQNLDRDLTTLIVTHSHVRVPAFGPRDVKSVVAGRDLQRSREQSLTAAHPT